MIDILDWLYGIAQCSIFILINNVSFLKCVVECSFYFSEFVVRWVFRSCDEFFYYFPKLYLFEQGRSLLKKRTNRNAMKETSFFRLRGVFILVLIFGLAPISMAQNYTYKTPGSGGIGKVYMGREIAGIMDFQGRAWLERDSRENEENTGLAIANLPVKANSIVADIGAGSGFYTFRIAPRVTEGKVYAVEIQDAAVEFLQSRSKALGISNVETIKGGMKSPNLPSDAIDLAIMVDVYHELEYPVEMLAAIKKSLKSDGKLLLIEYRGEDPAVAIRPLHKMTVEQLEKELSANGFKLVQNGQFMRIQHFLVFEKKE